jgi:hypothetical protein
MKRFEVQAMTYYSDGSEQGHYTICRVTNRTSADAIARMLRDDWNVKMTVQEIDLTLPDPMYVEGGYHNTFEKV